MPRPLSRVSTALLGLALVMCCHGASTLVCAHAAALPTSGAGAPKRIYIGNDDHTDYMWTATDLEYRQGFLNMLDFYMAQAEATATNPAHARGRFNCDGSLWVWEYERNKPAAAFQRLVDHLRAGTISMPLQTAVSLHGAMPAEATLRGMYYAGRLERRLDLRFPLVQAMENQTLPGGIASLWAGSGALYSWRGICGCATQINAANRPREIYHFQGPDGASVCMKWNSMRTLPSSIGGYAEARDPIATVQYLDSNADFLSRWPWTAAAGFGYGGDDFESNTTEFINAALTQSNASRQVVVSNQVDFFEDFLAQHTTEIPTFSGGFGNEWDLYTASMGELTADFKRNVERLRTAEALATVASLYDPGFMVGREVERDSAFLACGLYYEHDWTADGPISRTARGQWQRKIHRVMERYVVRLHDDALAAVAGLIPEGGGLERHAVFNPLSSTRTDVADLAVTTPAPRHVVDVSSGLEVASQSVTVGGSPRLRILASDVPSVGYRIYEVRPGTGQSFPPAGVVTLPSFDNGLYGVTLRFDGSLSSVIDHRDADRELVNSASSGVIHGLGNGNGPVTLESLGPVSATLRVVAGGTPGHETRVTMYAGVDRIDIEGLVTQNFSSNVSYRSSFNLSGAVMRHEEVGMIARVARAAQGGDYADQNTRTDWLTFNHFVDLSQATRGVTVSNWDSPFFKAGTSGVLTLDSTPVIRASVGMQVDGPDFGIPAQGGDTRFLHRFALRTHGAYDPAAAMRFALEHQNPLVAAPITGGPEAPLPDTAWSLVSLDSPDVLLWALKPAEEGIDQGVIARVWNLAEGQRAMRLSLPDLGIGWAMRTTHIETDLGPATLDDSDLVATLERQQIATFRLSPGLSLPAPPHPNTPRLHLATFPNPSRARGATHVAYALPNSGRVRVEVVDLRGAVVRTVFDEPRAAGSHRVVWDGLDQRGQGVRPGIYFVRVDAGGLRAVRRVVRLD